MTCMPFPNADDFPEFHYKNVHSITLTDNKGNDHSPEDWQPSATIIKKQFEQKKLSLEGNEEIFLVIVKMKVTEVRT